MFVKKKNATKSHEHFQSHFFLIAFRVAFLLLARTGNEWGLAMHLSWGNDDLHKISGEKI